MTGSAGDNTPVFVGKHGRPNRQSVRLQSESANAGQGHLKTVAEYSGARNVDHRGDAFFEHLEIDRAGNGDGVTLGLEEVIGSEKGTKAGLVIDQ